MRFISGGSFTSNYQGVVVLKPPQRYDQASLPRYRSGNASQTCPGTSDIKPICNAQRLALLLTQTRQGGSTRYRVTAHAKVTPKSITSAYAITFAIACN